MQKNILVLFAIINIFIALAYFFVEQDVKEWMLLAYMILNGALVFTIVNDFPLGKNKK